MIKKEPAGREVLEEALRRCCSVYCDQYPRYEDEIDLGDDYERYMNNLIRRSKKPFQRYFDTVGRRVAGIAAAILIVGCCSVTVAAARKPIVEFFENIHEKFVEFFFNADDIARAPDRIETVYIPGIIPDGYVMEEIQINEVSTDITWKNGNGDRLNLSQGVLFGSFIFDAEDSNYTVIEHHGIKIAVAEKYGSRACFWSSSEYEFSLVLSSDISTEDMLILIDSLKRYNQ